MSSLCGPSERSVAALMDCHPEQSEGSRPRWPELSRVEIPRRSAPRDDRSQLALRRAGRVYSRMRLLILLLPALPALAGAQSKSVDWPVYGGSPDHTHYSTIDQITPANVGKLQVAWTYATHDEFPGSEMQANPIVVDGVLYATTPKLRVFALDAATGRELWTSTPTGQSAGESLPASRSRRHGRPRPVHLPQQALGAR